MSKLNYEDIMKLEVGETLYEYAYGQEVKSVVIEPPYTEQDGSYALVKVKVSDGGEFRYGAHKDYPHYGPNVYNYQAYEALN